MTFSSKFRFTALVTAGGLLSACSGSQNYDSARYNGYQNSYNAPQIRRAYSAPTAGPSINVNYETLSVFEAPIATHIGDTTFVLRGRIDAPLAYSNQLEDHVPTTVVGNHQISAQTQLPNRITVGAVYGGRYENISGQNNDYNDDIAFYAGGSWGTVFAGNVSDLVEEETRRDRGVSLTDLGGNGTLGNLDEWSLGYKGRFGPAIVTGIIDEHSHYDVGVSVQRPIGVRDYRFTARHNTGEIVADDGITTLDTQAVSAVGEYVYGSSRVDFGGGYEQIDTVDRWFTTAGLYRKKGLWSVSLEGQYGDIDGQEDIAAIAAVRRDLARGLALTVSADYTDRDINIGGVQYIEDKDTRLNAALSFGF